MESIVSYLYSHFFHWNSQCGENEQQWNNGFLLFFRLQYLLADVKQFYSDFGRALSKSTLQSDMTCNALSVDT